LKIAYVAHLDLSMESGVNRKIQGQAIAWQAQGQDVLTQGSNVLDPLPVVEVQTTGWRDRFAAATRLVDRVLAWKPDAVYLRFDKSYPAFTRLADRVPVVAEANGSMREYIALGARNPLALAYQLATRGSLLRSCAGIVAITHEQGSAYMRYRAPVLTMPNGIHLEDYPVVARRASDRPGLFFIGSPGYPWQGLDEVLRFAGIMRDWDFHIVGWGFTDVRAGITIPANCSLHGYMKRSQYIDIVAKCDAGLGTMALWRKRFQEASPLKVREYLASGLPVILGYHDSDVSGMPCCLEVPNRRGGLLSSELQVREFLASWQGKRVAHEQLAPIGSELKEAERVAFVSRCAFQWRQRHTNS
jgi:glycosyltransferase involved in cell wall biosynthesis